MSDSNQGAFHTGSYRNLFKELGYSFQEIESKLEQAWNELFYGNPEMRIYYPLGDDKGYLLDTGNLDVRSEGMSYGMMMAVQMNKKMNSTDYGTMRRRSCSIRTGVTSITLRGIASRTALVFRKVQHPTGKSFSPWP